MLVNLKEILDLAEKLDDIFKDKYNKELAKNTQRNSLIVKKLFAKKLENI